MARYGKGVGVSDNQFDNFSPYESPGSMELELSSGPEDNRPWGPWWSLLWTFVVVCVWQLAQLAVLLFFAVREMGVEGLTAESLQEFAEGAMVSGDIVGAVGFCSGLVGVILILAIVKVKGVSLSDGLSLKKFRKGWMWLLLLPGWIIGALAITVISSLFAKDGAAADQEGIFDLVNGTQNYLWLILGVSVGAPFFEEFLFRGLLHEGLRQSFLGPWGSGVIIGILFSAIHMQYQDPSAFVALFLLGMLFTAARELTGSLWAAVAIHFIQNTYVTLSMILVISGAFPEEMVPEELKDLVPDAVGEEVGLSTEK